MMNAKICKVYIRLLLQDKVKKKEAKAWHE